MAATQSRMRPAPGRSSRTVPRPGTRRVGKALGVQVNVIGDLSPVRPLENTIADLIGSDKLKRVMLLGHVDNTTPAMNSFDGPGWDKLVMGEVRRVRINRDDCSWSLKWALKPSDIGRKDYKS